MGRLELCRFLYAGPNGVMSICEIAVHALTDARTAVICTELEDNPGGSVTACAASLAGLVCREQKIDPAGLVWIEHNPSRGTGDSHLPETWELVTFALSRDLSSDMRFSEPQWRPMSLQDWNALGLPYPP